MLRRLPALTILTLASVSLLVTACAQPSTASAPETVETRVGPITLELGVPTEESTQKLYDEMDFQRAVLAHQISDS